MGRSPQPAPAPEEDPDRERLALQENPTDHWRASRPVLAAHHLVLAMAALAHKAQRACIREEPRTLRKSTGSTRYASPYFRRRSPRQFLYSCANATWDTAKRNR